MSQNLQVHDPIEFDFQTQLKIHGFIASISGNKAHVVSDSDGEFIVSLQLLRRRKGVAPKRVYTTEQRARWIFVEGDKVQFNNGKNKQIVGNIAQLNPVRARIDAGGQFWNVPYTQLELHGSNENARKDAAFKKISSTANQADRLLKAHNLSDWRFTYDHARKRAGSCTYAAKLITMSEQFCLKADEAAITDTILHEIAHALVGEEHGHDAVWQATAMAIGCSAERTHCLNFSSPKYIVSCPVCGTYGAREKRGRGQVCRTCKTPVTYEFYSEERWNAYSSD